MGSMPWTVAAREDELVPLLGESADGGVLIPVAEAVELEGVDVLAVGGEEVVDEDAVEG